MPNVSCRLPPKMGEKIEEAVAERKLYRSELLRAALRHCIETNPDGYSAFGSARQSATQPSGERSTSGSSENANNGNPQRIYDPTSNDW